MKKLLAILAAFFIGIGLIYGAWKIRTTLNYHLMYKAKIEEQIKPIKEQLNDLEERVRKLEGEKKLKITQTKPTISLATYLR